MDLVFKYGQMVLNIKEIGNIIEHVEKGNSGMLMVISTKVNGRMIRQMDMDDIFIQTVQNILAIGKMIFNKVKVLKHGLMVQNIKDNIIKGKNKVKENMNGLMAQNILDNG